MAAEKKQAPRNHNGFRRRHGINPQHYLTQLLINLQDTPVNELDRWLPDQWKTAQPAATAT